MNFEFQCSNNKHEAPLIKSTGVVVQCPTEMAECVSPFLGTNMKQICSVSGSKAVAALSIDCTISGMCHLAQVATIGNNADSEVNAGIYVPHNSRTVRDLMQEIRQTACDGCCILSENSEDINDTCNRVVSSFVGDMLEVLMKLRVSRRFLGTLSPESIYHDHSYGFIAAPINSYKPNAMFTIFKMDESYKTIYTSKKLHNMANNKDNFVCNERMGDMLARTDMYSIAVVALEMIFNFFSARIAEITKCMTFMQLVERFECNMPLVLDFYLNTVHLVVNDTLTRALTNYLNF